MGNKSMMTIVLCILVLALAFELVLVKAHSGEDKGSKEKDSLIELMAHINTLLSEELSPSIDKNIGIQGQLNVLLSSETVQERYCIVNELTCFLQEIIKSEEMFTETLNLVTELQINATNWIDTWELAMQEYTDAKTPKSQKKIDSLRQVLEKMIQDYMSFAQDTEDELQQLTDNLKDLKRTVGIVQQIAKSDEEKTRANNLDAAIDIVLEVNGLFIEALSASSGKWQLILEEFVNMYGPASRKKRSARGDSPFMDLRNMHLLDAGIKEGVQPVNGHFEAFI